MFFIPLFLSFFFVVYRPSSQSSAFNSVHKCQSVNHLLVSRAWQDYLITSAAHISEIVWPCLPEIKRSLKIFTCSSTTVSFTTPCLPITIRCPLIWLDVGYHVTKSISMMVEFKFWMGVMRSHRNGWYHLSNWGWYIPWLLLCKKHWLIISFFEKI